MGLPKAKLLQYGCEKEIKRCGVSDGREQITRKPKGLNLGKLRDKPGHAANLIRVGLAAGIGRRARRRQVRQQARWANVADHGGGKRHRRAGGHYGVLAARQPGQDCSTEGVPGAGRVEFDRGNPWYMGNGIALDDERAALAECDEQNTAWLRARGLDAAKQQAGLVLVHKEQVNRLEQRADEIALVRNRPAISSGRQTGHTPGTAGPRKNQLALRAAQCSNVHDGCVLQVTWECLGRQRNLGTPERIDKRRMPAPVMRDFKMR
jgi:hypothetical protein